MSILGVEANEDKRKYNLARALIYLACKKNNNNNILLVFAFNCERVLAVILS